MKQIIVDILERLKDNYDQVSPKLQKDLHGIQKFMTEKIWKHEFEDVEKLKRFLEVELYGEIPSDDKSYYLGRIHAIIELIKYFNTPREIHEKAMNLTPLENKFLQYIESEGEVCPSHIAKELNIDNKQHITNILRRLRSKELLYVTPSGKNRWYSLTPIGKQVMTALQNTISATIEQKEMSEQKIPEQGIRTEGYWKKMNTGRIKFPSLEPDVTPPLNKVAVVDKMSKKSPVLVTLDPFQDLGFLSTYHEPIIGTYEQEGFTSVLYISNNLHEQEEQRNRKKEPGLVCQERLQELEFIIAYRDMSVEAKQVAHAKALSGLYGISNQYEQEEQRSRKKEPLNRLRGYRSDMQYFINEELVPR